MPLPGLKGEKDRGSAKLENELVRQIAEAENSDQWTLMHRFNKAADLLDLALRVSSHCQQPLKSVNLDFKGLHCAVLLQVHPSIAC